MRRFLTPKQAGERLQVSAQTVRNMFRAGKLKGVVCGPHLIRICPDSVDNYREEPKPPPKRVVKDYIGGLR